MLLRVLGEMQSVIATIMNNLFGVFLLLPLTLHSINMQHTLLEMLEGLQFACSAGGGGKKGCIGVYLPMIPHKYTPNRPLV